MSKRRPCSLHFIRLSIISTIALVLLDGGHQTCNSWLLQIPTSDRVALKRANNKRYMSSKDTFGESQINPLSSNKRLTGAFLRTPPRIHLIPSHNQTTTQNKDKEWELFFNLYQDQYLAKNQSTVVDIAPGPSLHQSPLRNWCANQRKSYMKTLGLLDMSEAVNWGIEGMTLQRKQRLDSVGFYWGDNIEPKNVGEEEIFSREYQEKVRKKYIEDLVWNPWYNRLVQFYHQHGHTNVGQFNNRTNENATTATLVDKVVEIDGKEGLEQWVEQQRLVRTIMPDRRRKKLDALGFNWYVSEKNQSAVLNHERIATMDIPIGKKAKVSFARRIQQLETYKEKYGNVHVPFDYDELEGLGRWVQRQRINKRLSLKSRLRLEALGLQSLNL